MIFSNLSLLGILPSDKRGGSPTEFIGTRVSQTSGYLFFVGGGGGGPTAKMIICWVHIGIPLFEPWSKLLVYSLVTNTP